MSSQSAAGASRPLAVITGASEGIGRDLAALYAAAGHDVAIVARREALLQQLARELEERHGVRCLIVVADLARREECERLVALVEPERARVVALVNNAGLGSLGWFHETPLERDLTQIDLNVSALTHLTKRMLPWLRANGRGHVMNVASVASFQPGPLMAVYYATKAYVLSFSEALANECQGTGVTVTAVCPGPTTTGFRRQAHVPPNAPGGGTPPMTSRAVAELAFHGTRAGKPVVITGLRNRVAAFFGRHLPRGMTAGVVRRVQEARLRAGTGD
jgi:uncharacterized protein